eukprot:125901-Rhodomonas_salina.2
MAQGVRRDRKPNGSAGSGVVSTRDRGSRERIGQQCSRVPALVVRAVRFAAAVPTLALDPLMLADLRTLCQYRAWQIFIRHVSTGHGVASA